MPGSFNADAKAQLIADVLNQAPDAKGKLFAKKLELTCAHNDSFARFCGPAPDTVDHRDPNRGNYVFWHKDDFTKFAGDKMQFTIAGAPAGPGVRGEGELTGNTSTIKFGQYFLTVDFKRDAVELTQKQLKFLAAGQSVEDFALDKLGEKMGWFRMWDMKMSLIKHASGNVVRPNGRKTRDQLTSADTLEPGFLTSAKPQLQRIGGVPLAIKKFGEQQSPVLRYIAYFADVAGENIRASTQYQNAIQHAADRGDKNPNFTGELVDWNNIALFEHTMTHPDWDDVIGDPCAPIATLGTPFGVDSAQAACKLVTNSANTKSLYYQFFPGYDYIFEEGQTPVVDNAVYYAWLVNPDGSVGLVRYTGSGNNGNQVTLTGILSPAGDGTDTGTSTLGFAQLGNIICTGDTWSDTPGEGGIGEAANTSADFLYTDTFTAGAMIIPANANGCAIMRSFLFGQGAALRGRGSLPQGKGNMDVMIEQKRDYGFVIGAGYQSIYGQSARKRTDGITHGYLMMEHTGQHPGLEVPSL